MRFRYRIIVHDSLSYSNVLLTLYRCNRTLLLVWTGPMWIDRNTLDLTLKLKGQPVEIRHSTPKKKLFDLKS